RSRRRSGTRRRRVVLPPRRKPRANRSSSGRRVETLHRCCIVTVHLGASRPGGRGTVVCCSSEGPPMQIVLGHRRGRTVIPYPRAAEQRRVFLAPPQSPNNIDIERKPFFVT